MENQSVKINFDDVRDIAKRIAQTGEYDNFFNAERDLDMLTRNAQLSEADKCVLGLAYTFWPLKNDSVSETKRTHRFFLHNFWKAACAMENVFKRYGDIDCGFKSTAPFVNGTIDAVFVIINSMSRGFNITFDKSFGGDRHLKYLAAIFAMNVCKHYFSFLGIGNCACGCENSYEDSFSRFADRIGTMAADASFYVGDIEMRTMYSQLLSWLRVRTHRAFDVFCGESTCGVVNMDRLNECFERSIPYTMKSDHIAVFEANSGKRAARKLRLAAKAKEMSAAPKKVEAPSASEELNIGFEPEPKPVKINIEDERNTQENAKPKHAECACGGRCKCNEHKNDGENAKPDYDSVATFSFNGRKTTFSHIKDTNVFDITGSTPIHDEDIALAKKFGIIPFDFKLVDGGRRGISNSLRG